MEKKRLTILIIALVGMLGTFLPWAKLGPLSVTGTDGDGWYTFVLFAIGGAAALFLGDRSTPMSKGALTGVWITAVIAFIVGIIDVFDVSGNASVGFGLILVVLAAIAQVLVAFLMKVPQVSQPVARQQAAPAPPGPSATPEPKAEPAAPAPGTAPQPERPAPAPEEPSTPTPPPEEAGEEETESEEEEEEDDTRSYE
jgi:hypothetical protein